MNNQGKNIAAVEPPAYPASVEIGSAFISIIEPDVGYEREFNRWYEDDHFYSGAMCLPWMFAGRRWVATKKLRELRYPETSNVAQPVTAGCYLHLYWIEKDRLEDLAPLLGQELKNLFSVGRMLTDGSNSHRRHVYSCFQPYRGAIYRDVSAMPRDIHALDYPFAGVVVEVIEAAANVTRDNLVRWLQMHYIPDAIAGSSTAMCLTFLHAPMPAGLASGVKNAAPGAKKALPSGERRVTLLWFTDVDPQSCWEHDFVGHGATVKESGLGELQLAAPFIPTYPGTDIYVDQLR